MQEIWEIPGFLAYCCILFFNFLSINVSSNALQAESSEDLFEWKTALEQALAQAPSAALVMGHNGIFRNDNTEAFEGSIQHCSFLPFITSYINFIKLNCEVEGGYNCCFFFLIAKCSVNFFFFAMALTGREKRPTKSLVVGRPILLALEDIDGGPSFLEKALRFLEKNGRCLLLGAFVGFVIISVFHMLKFCGKPVCIIADSVTGIRG